ncbi:MAG: hypothetical protein ABI867_01310 [Kofleriaceae bacterium]
MDPREQAIEAVMQKARANRPRTSRVLWIVAGVVGLACIVGFVAIVLSDDDLATPSPVATDSGPGFTAGILIGAVVGIVLGIALARRGQLHSSNKSP